MRKDLKVKLLKSFVYNKKGGNGAGLVIIDETLVDKEYISIASKVGLSETAFVSKLNDTNYDVRFFTPVSEVELCGHATIAAFYYIGEYLIKDKKDISVYQNTKAGRLRVDIQYKDEHVNNIMMEQAEPIIYGELNNKLNKSIAKSLSISYENIGFSFLNDRILPNIVSTGLRDFMIPVKSRDILNEINPNYDEINTICKENNVVGYHVFTIDNNKIYARNFAPLYGIDEECATGTSNGALGALLYDKHIFNKQFEVLQGEKMGELSCIIVNVDKMGVEVGGKAVFIEEITLSI